METHNSIYFAQVQKPTPWLEFVCENFAVQSTARALELRDFGALYLNQKRWRPSDEAWLNPQDIVRVHLKPRRFSAKRLQEVQVLENNTDWMLVWKPSGLPTHETLDNLHENCKAWVEKMTQVKLWSLGRLDVGTRGLLLFGKNSEFAREYHHLLQMRRSCKFYESLSPLPKKEKGLWRHRMKKSDRAPKEIVPWADESLDLSCELEILDQNPFLNDFFLSRIQLLTGRTHQIRAQFAFEGAPILGDQTYGSKVVTDFSGNEFALSCESFTFEDKGRTLEFQRPSSIPTLAESWMKNLTESGISFEALKN